LYLKELIAIWPAKSDHEAEIQPVNKKSIAISLFLYTAFSYPIYAAEPGFDCQKATEWVEHVICKSDNLSREGKKLAKLYQNVMARVTDDIKIQIKSDQRTWLKKRNDGCRRNVSEVENCLLTEYRERMQHFQHSWLLILLIDPVMRH